MNVLKCCGFVFVLGAGLHDYKSSEIERDSCRDLKSVGGVFVGEYLVNMVKGEYINNLLPTISVSFTDTS